jgi:hypothetical protein
MDIWRKRSNEEFEHWYVEYQRAQNPMGMRKASRLTYVGLVCHPGGSEKRRRSTSVLRTFGRRTSPNSAAWTCAIGPPASPSTQKSSLNLLNPSAGSTAVASSLRTSFLIADCFANLIWRVDLPRDGTKATARVWLKHDSTIPMVRCPTNLESTAWVMSRAPITFITPRRLKSSLCVCATPGSDGSEYAPNSGKNQA